MIGILLIPVALAYDVFAWWTKAPADQLWAETGRKSSEMAA